MPHQWGTHYHVNASGVIVIYQLQHYIGTEEAVCLQSFFFFLPIDTIFFLND
jgi:hypothetical protein